MKVAGLVLTGSLSLATLKRPKGALAPGLQGRGVAVPE